SATLVPPVPTVCAACGGPGGGALGLLLPPKLKRSPPGKPEHAATSIVDAAAAAICRNFTAACTRPAPGNTFTLPGRREYSVVTERSTPHNVGEVQRSQKLMSREAHDAWPSRR